MAIGQSDNEYDALVTTAPKNEYDNLVGEVVSEKATAFKSAMQSARDTNPDDHAETVNLSKRTGLPVETISRNKDYVKKQAPFITNEYDDMLNTHPKTAGFLAEEDNAKFAKDDLEVLKGIEKIAGLNDGEDFVDIMGKSFSSGLNSVNASIMRVPAYAYNVGAAVYNLAAIPQNAIARAVGRPEQQVKLGVAPEGLLNNPLAQYYQKAAESIAPEELNQDPIQLFKEGNSAQAARAISAQVVANLPLQIALIASSLSGAPAAGLGMAGLVQASEANKEAQDLGKDAVSSAIDATLQGGIESAFESVGTLGVLKHWEGVLTKSFGKASAKQVMLDVGKTLGYSFLAEGNEELLTSFAQDFSDYITGNPNAMDGTIQRAMNAFIIGGLSGFGITSPTAVTTGAIKSHKLNQNIKFWTDFVGMSAQSKLRTRSPEKFEAYANQVLAESGKPSNIYLPYEAVKTFFQGNPAEFEKFIDDLGIRDQLKDAADAGKEFEISAAKWAAKYAGSDVSQAVNDFIRFSPDGMTAAEQKNLKEDRVRAIQEMQREYDEYVKEAALPVQLQAIRDKLLLPKDTGGFGLSAEDADAQVSVFLAGAKVLSKQSGESVDQWFSRVNPQLNIGGQYIAGPDTLLQDQENKIKTDASVSIAKRFGKNVGLVRKFLDGKATAAAVVKDDALIPELMALRDEVTKKISDSKGQQGGELFQIPVEAAAQIDIPLELPKTPLFESAVKNTPGAKITEQGLVINLVRFQNPTQEGKTSIRTGVFYLPAGSPQAKYYSTGKNGYGGTQKFEGETLLKRPLFVKGATGGKAPELAFNSIKGKNAYSEMRREVLDKAWTGGFNRIADLDGIREVLEKYGADPEMAEDIVVNSRQGNTLPYAIQENIVAHAVREAGYDAVIGYSTKRGEAKGEAFISEVFDVREFRYPSRSQDTTIHPDFKFKENTSKEGGASGPRFQDASAPRGSVQFTKPATIINLYKSANLSTFLHESAHVFMNEMQKIVDAKLGDEQFNKDYEALVKFVGGDIKSVEAQEKLARAFEAYLREGKAPSIKLAEAFRRFKQWLTAIYRSVAGLNVEINDEVRQVFDRLLASENEIEDAKLFYASKQSLADLIPVTPEQKKKLQKSKAERDAAALERQAKTLLNAYLEATGGRAEIRAFATKSVDKQPIYQAVKEVRDNGGFDLDEMKRIYGKDITDQIRAAHPGVLKRQVKAKKPRSYFAEVLAHGGINPNSLGELELKHFKEFGLFGVLRKDGGSFDEVAQEMESQGLLQVPGDKNPGDYLKGLLEQKANMPSDEYVEPAELVPPTEIAVAYGFKSVQDLIAELAKAPSRGKAISDLSKQLIAQKEQDIKKDMLQQESVSGEEALHNDASLTYLIAEAEVLASKLDAAKNRRPEQLEAAVYRAAAEEVIGKKPLRLATRYDLYARAEQRYAKQALDFAQKGEWQNAMEAKKRQILNHSLVQEAIRVRDAKQTIEEGYKTKKFKAKLDRVENAFVDPVLDLATAYGLVSGEQFTPKTQDAIQGVKDLDEVLYSAIPEWIVNKRTPTKFEDYRDLPSSQFFELDDTIKSILHYGSDQMKSIEEGEAKTLQEWVTASVDKMSTLKDKVDATGKTKNLRDESSVWSKPLKFIDAFASGASLVQFTADWADGFSFLKTGNAGPFKTLYNKVLKSESTFFKLKEATLKQSKGAWNTIEKAARRIAQQHGVYIQIQGVPIPADLVRTGRAFWDANKMVALLLNTGNEGNIEAIKRAYGYSDQQIQKVASYFTEKELRAIQEIWEATDLHFADLDKVHFSIYNRHVSKVVPKPINFISSDGKTVELKGGYYPLIFDHNISDVAAVQQEEDLMKNQMNSVIRSTKPSDGFTYSRTPGHSIPPLLDISVWFTHVNNTSRYIAYARELRDLNRLTGNKEWKTVFRQKLGEEHYDGVRSWLSYNANPGKRLLSTRFDRAANGSLTWFRSLSTAAILGFKTAVGLKQRVAIISAAQALGRDKITNGWNWIGKAYREVDFRTSVLGLGNGRTWQEMTKKSDYLKTRDGNIDREINDMRKGIDPLVKKFTIKGKEFTAADIQDFAFEWIKMNDRATVAVVWTAAYNQYVEEKAAKGITPEQLQKAAVAYADGIVQDTQASSLSPELSAVQRQEGWLRLFTMFMTSSMNYGNRVMQNYRAWNEGAISNKEFFNHALQEYFFMPWLALMIGSAVGDGDLPEWWEMALAPFEQLVSWIPLVRDVFSYYHYGSEIGRTTIFEPANRAVKAAGGVAKFVMGDREFTEVLWDIGRVIEVYYKVPALNFVKDVKGIYDNITGQE